MRYCTNCGKEITNNNRFCPHCGQPVEAGGAHAGINSEPFGASGEPVRTNGQPGIVRQKRNRNTKGFVAAVIAALVLLAVIAGVLLLRKGSPEGDLQKQLSLGDRYLSDLDYDRAIDAYQGAIEIDPKSTDAYQGLALAYTGKADETEDPEESDGYREEAVNAYESLLNLDSGNEAAREQVVEQYDILIEHSEGTGDEEAASEYRARRERHIQDEPGETPNEPGENGQEEQEAGENQGLPFLHDEAFYADYYSAVLGQYSTLINMTKAGDQTYDFVNDNGLSIEFVFDVSAGGEGYYRFYDINGDGFDELLAGGLYDGKIVIHDIYTQGSEAPSQVFESSTVYALGERYRATFDVDNHRIYIDGSFSAFSAYVSVYDFAPGAETAVFAEGYTNDSAHSEVSWDYFYTDSAGNKSELAKEKFDEVFAYAKGLHESEILDAAEWKVIE